MHQIITIVCFACIAVQIATSQCLNRQPNFIYNRQIPETIVETPLIYPQPQSAPVYQTVRELQPLSTPQIRDIQLLTSKLNEIQPLLNPTTIITDCTPSVCKTLTDIIQLMSVANLIKDKKGGPDIALQLAEPFLKEKILSQPNLFLTNPVSPLNPSVISPFSNPVLTSATSSNFIIPSNPVSTNFVNPNLQLITPSASLYPNFVSAPNFISSLPISQATGFSNGNTNALVGNLLSMLGH